MSNRYKGGVISATPPTTTGGEDGTASGAWTLEQQMQLQAAGLWPAQPTGPYIEQVFSTYLYTGAGTSKTITNNIDLSTKGGLVWTKMRTSPASNAHDHRLSDSAIGVNQVLSSNNTNPKTSSASFGISAFNVDGYTITNPGGDGGWNYTNDTFVSWTFRKQPKFFDVQTWTGTGSPRTIAHNLGSVPGFIIVKRTDTTGNWICYHRSLNTTAGQMIVLNLSAYGALTEATSFNSTAPTSTVFTVGTGDETNGSGGTFVAYIFAHNAGGFGLSGTDNVISCGSYTGNGSTDGPVIDLGYEPQWLLIKSSSASNTAWTLIDNMRGMTVGGADAYLKPNSSDAETTSLDLLSPTATGFKLTSTLGLVNGANDYIYIAIRRGPMRVPTSGTSVFEPKTMTATQANLSITGVGFPPDLVINGVRSNANYGQQVTDRLRGVTKQVFTEYDSAENTTNGTAVVSLNMNGISLGADTGGTGWNAYSGYTSVKWMFGRAPSFFDEVCYTGNGGNPQVVTHNLTVVPEMILVKARSIGYQWIVYHSGLGTGSFMELNSTASAVAYAAFPAVSATTFSADSSYNRASGQTFVAYLFATCAGVSKVGSYTGTGALQTVNCGFAAGARFVLIKRTDSTGDWFVWDSARGISSGNDPYLLLNSAAAEVTGTNYVDTTAVGFQVTAAAPAGLNANGGTFIFLAIA